MIRCRNNPNCVKNSRLKFYGIGNKGGIKAYIIDILNVNTLRLLIVNVSVPNFTVSTLSMMRENQAKVLSQYIFGTTSKDGVVE